MLSVYQPWDPLKVCVVGRGYGPEYYNWIKDSTVRTLFEKIAVESEEDFQEFIKLLENFGVKVLRPNLSPVPVINGVRTKPPLLPRDHIGMIGNVFYENVSFNFKEFYENVKDSSWPSCTSLLEFYNLPTHIQEECIQVHNMWNYASHTSCYNNVIDYVRSQGNAIKSHVRNELDICNRAMIFPCGHDYFVGMWEPNVHGRDYVTSTQEIQDFVDSEFPYTKNHVVYSGGHLDSSFCIVKPGLIFSDYGNYGLEPLFPDWEIVTFPSTFEQLDQTRKPLRTKEGNYLYDFLNFEQDPKVKSIVKEHLSHWTGNSRETVFDVNVFTIDEKNVVVCGCNDEQLRVLERHGMTAHHINLRHKWFWDGGIHCFTSDLHREGSPRNLFA